MKPRLRVKQKITAFVNKYQVFDISDGKSDELVAFAQQKRLNLKEKILFYDSEDKSNLIFTLRAEKVLDVHGKYFVEDPYGELIGSFSKDFKKSLTNSTWHLFDSRDNEVLVVFESSSAVAAFRRFASFIPLIGGLIEIIVAFIRYHFVFGDPNSRAQHGMYRKITIIRDHYELQMDDEAYSKTDWRVFAAICIALDALQSR